MLEHIQSAHAHVATIASSYESFADDGTFIVGDNREGSEIIPGTPQHVRGTLLKGGWWHISGCALNARVLLENGLFDATLPHMGDWEWSLRCLHAGWDILYIPRALVGWRQHLGSYSSHSMRTAGYVQQQLSVLNKYGTALTRLDLISWHFRQLLYVLRRMVRAVQQRNLLWFRAAIKSAALILSNAVKSQWQRHL